MQKDFLCKTVTTRYKTVTTLKQINATKTL